MTEPIVIPASPVPKGAQKNESAKAGDAHALAAQAESLLKNGRLEEAENVIRSALDQSRDNWQYFSTLGRVWSAQNRLPEAVDAFRHAVALSPIYNALPHWYLGEVLLKKGELWEAEAEIRRAISINPKASAYHSSLGALLLEQRLFEDAYSSLRHAIRLDRRSPQPRILIAKLYVAQGNYRGAEKSLAKALAFVPEPHSVLWALSKLFEDQGKFDEAIAWKKKMLGLDPNNAKIHVQICNLCEKAGRLDAAEQAIRAALVLQPAPANYHRLSVILCAKSRPIEAIAAMSEACRLDIENQAYRLRLTKLTASGIFEVPEPPKSSSGPTGQSGVLNPELRLIDRIRRFWRIKKNR